MKTFYSFFLAFSFAMGAFANPISLCEDPTLKVEMDIQFNGEELLRVSASDFINTNSNTCPFEVFFIDVYGNKRDEFIVRSHSLDERVEVELMIMQDGKDAYLETVEIVPTGVGPEAISIYFEDLPVTAGDPVDVRVWSSDIESFVFMQFGINYRNATFKALFKNGILQDGLDIGHHNNETINFLWVHPPTTGISIDKDQDWFSLRFLPQLDGNISDLLDFASPAIVGEIGYMDNGFLQTFEIDYQFKISRRIISDLDEIDPIDFSIYPNPSIDILNINGLNDQNYRFNIYNLLGKQVMAGQLRNKSLDVSTLLKGKYILSLTNEDSKVSKAFIKLDK